MFGLRPIWGIEHMRNSNGTFTRTWGGGRIYGGIGKHLGFYASLRDNHMADILSRPDYLTRREGGNYKSNDIGGGDYSEMRGGITYSWKWGHVGLVKDHLEWGDNYHGSNILSGRNPSFAMLKLHLNPADWFAFDYFHGWLVSEVIDTNRSYTPSSGYNRPIYRNKYMAANMFTFTPLQKIDIAFGNSIIYGDIPVQGGYLIPFMFFKSVDHTINAHIENQNSQMFGNISIKSIPHLHVYASLFVDEFSIKRVGDPNRHNFHSYKTGFRIYNWPLPNITITGSYTQTSPITYKHRIPVLTFTTNKYNLGHYLQDNAKIYYSALEWKPFRSLQVKLGYEYAIHGREYAYQQTQPSVDTYATVEEKTWDRHIMTLQAKYRFSSNSSVFVGFTRRNIQGYATEQQQSQVALNRYTPDFFHNKTETLRVGLHTGF